MKTSLSQDAVHIAQLEPVAQRESRERATAADSLANSPRMVAQRQWLERVNPRRVTQANDAPGEAAPRKATIQGGGDGLPQALRSGMELLSGMDLSGVRVHRNSDQPVRLDALAYAQGNEIHLGAGQEQHLPHEAWHVVQQRQGRVRPTMQLAGAAVNEDPGLEREADSMGQKALARSTPTDVVRPALSQASRGVEAPADKQRQLGLSWQESAGPVVDDERSTLQRFKKTFEGENESKKKPADPFQIAAAQFDAAYDINAYSQDLKQYRERCDTAVLQPVIDFRFYELMLQENLEKYAKQARALISKIFDSDSFDISYSVLRDETLEPGTSPEGGDEKEPATIERVANTLNSLKGQDLKLPKNHRLLSGNAAVKNEKRIALDKPIEKMLNGDMMIPIDDVLYSNTDEKKSSHQILLDEVFKNAGQQPRAVEKPRRLRSNSNVKPDTFTLTNLVTGDDKQTLATTVAACAAAFTKGATQVLLIVEESRAEGQENKLKELYNVTKNQLVTDQRAQQSGVKLSEQGKAVPVRYKLTVTPRPNELEQQ